MLTKKLIKGQKLNKIFLTQYLHYLPRPTFNLAKRVTFFITYDTKVSKGYHYPF